MIVEAKRFFIIAVNSDKRFTFNHNNKTNVSTLRVWTSTDAYYTFTVGPEPYIPEGSVMVKFFRQPLRDFNPTPNAREVDRLFPSAHRKAGLKHVFVPFEDAAEAIQNIKSYASERPDEVLRNYMRSPEEVL